MSGSDLYLALDQGGHASRALLFDQYGDVIAAASVAIATRHPAPDYVEHDAEDVLASLRLATEQAIQRVDDSRPIVAAGLATQRSSIVCWSRRDGRALSPLISWQDRRTAAWLGGLRDKEAMIRQKTGLVLSPHYGASKMRWCLEHLPAVRTAFEQGDLACGPLASFLGARLTIEGHILTDPANASRTLLYNLSTTEWDAELLALFDIPVGVMPRCVPTRHDFGRIRTIRGPIPLTVVTGDQSAALFGFGEPSLTSALLNLGTGAFVQRPVTARPPPSHLLTSLAYADSGSQCFVLEGTVNGAGSALAWACQHLAIAEDEAMVLLPQWLSSVPSPPLFINSVSGIGSPHWCPSVTPRFLGEGSTAARLVAVVESIVFLIQDNLHAMNDATTPPSCEVIVSGGLAQLDGLCQRLADLSGLKVRRPRALEATARGVAFLLAAPARQFRPVIDDRVYISIHDESLISRYHRWQAALEPIISSGH